MKCATCICNLYCRTRKRRSFCATCSDRESMRSCDTKQCLNAVVTKRTMLCGLVSASEADDAQGPKTCIVMAAVLNAISPVHELCAMVI